MGCVLTPVEPADVSHRSITSRLQVDRESPEHNPTEVQLIVSVLSDGLSLRLVFTLLSGERFNRGIMNNPHFPEFFMPALIKY